MSKKKVSVKDDIERLKGASISSFNKRTRLPQPLYWSLFNSEIARIKARKNKKRLLESIFG